VTRRVPSPSPSKASSNPSPPQGLNLRQGLAVAWLLLFCCWFFSFGLPNNRFVLTTDQPTVRWMVWKVLPFDLLDLIDPPTEPNSIPWSWLYLGQRIPFLVIACVVWAGGICVGRLELRAIHLKDLFDRAERFFFATCLGLATMSLAMLGLGLLGLLNRWPLMALIVAATAAELWLTWRDFVRRSQPAADVSKPRHSTSSNSGAVSGPGPGPAASGTAWLPWIVAGIIGPIVFGILLGAMSPQVDFDVIEYHLGGPKEWFQQGRITRLPHNVYTSFPFLTEMLLLSGMALYGDWNWGALAGQAIIAGFAPLTAIGLFATARRWFSPTAGWFAVLVWLTTPWAYRISIYAYAEGGLACYLFATFAVLLRLAWFEGPHSAPSPSDADLTMDASGNPVATAAAPAAAGTNHMTLLCGLMAGSAMACKYTGLVSAIIPAGLMLAWICSRSAATTKRLPQSVTIGLMFAAGISVSIGPWLSKNLVETGNPVFPLAYSLFGGDGRDATMDAQWKRGHSSHYPSELARLRDVPVKVTDVVANNDWHSPLMFGLAPLALLASWRKKVWMVWLLIGWQFLTWFYLTHHIDRFYVPMFPLVALLAGCGAGWLATFPFGRWCGGIVIAACILFNVWIMQKQGVSGFNAGRMDLKVAADLVVSPSIRWLNAEFAAGRLPGNGKVLCVGEAALFHAQFPYLYNTVFDRSLFEQWCADRTDTGDFRLKPVNEIRETLHRHGVTHVLVNWSEILRYREPGSYGYTDFAHPDWLAVLQKSGVLDPPLPIPDSVSFVPIDSIKRQQVTDWVPTLRMSLADRPGIRAVQVFPVRQMETP